MSVSYDDLASIGGTDLSTPLFCMLCLRTFRTLVPRSAPTAPSGSSTAPAARLVCPTCNVPGRHMSESQYNDVSAALERAEHGADDSNNAATAEHGAGANPLTSMMARMSSLISLLSGTFGEDEVFENVFQGTSNDTATDKRAVDALPRKYLGRKPDVEEAKSYDIITEVPTMYSLHVFPRPDVSESEFTGVLELQAVPAAFSAPFPGSSASATTSSSTSVSATSSGGAVEEAGAGLTSKKVNIVVAEPLTGAGFLEIPLRNADAIKDNIVVMTRGDISFAAKALCAEKCGARGLIVIQSETNKTQWPLQMVDNMNLLQGNRVSIPVAMISYADGSRLLPAVQKAAVCGFLHAKVRSEHCPVCMDTFEPGTVMTFMPCQHFFHDDCIGPWLQKRNTCPLCRYSLPTASGEMPGAREEALRREREQTALQWYG